jgi:hypothetical protein
MSTEPAQPGERVEVAMIDSLPLPRAHVEVEADGEAVLLSVEAPDLVNVEFTLLLSPAEARQLGDLLFRLGCAGAPESR